MWLWLTGLFQNKSLDSILGQFTKVHDQLDKFAESAANEIDRKNELVDDLTNQINTHRSEMDRAHSVMVEVKKFIGL